MSAPARITATCLVAGEAEGRVTLLTSPLSLWGGFDPESGLIVDATHPQKGQEINGRVLVMPGGRGSSSSSSVLLESARLGTQPGAIVLVEPDPILVVGALVAADLYGICIPLVSIHESCLDQFTGVDSAHVSARPGAAFVAIS